MKLVKLGSNACIIALLTVMALQGSSRAFAQEVKLFESPGSVADKPDTLYRISRFSLRGGTVFNMAMTIRSLHHPTIATRPDGSVLGTYQFVELEAPGKYFGDRNTFGVVASNVALDFGIDFLTQKMHRRGGKMARLATVLNFLQAANRVRAGFNDARLSAGANDHVRAETGWQGRIKWVNRPPR